MKKGKIIIIVIWIFFLVGIFIYSKCIEKKEVIESYKVVLETLKDELKDGVITPEERARINEQMISVAEKIDNVNDKHNAFLKDILTKVGGTVVGVLLLGATILGINRKDD